MTKTPRSARQPRRDRDDTPDVDVDSDVATPTPRPSRDAFDHVEAGDGLFSANSMGTDVADPTPLSDEPREFGTWTTSGTTLKSGGDGAETTSLDDVTHTPEPDNFISFGQETGLLQEIPPEPEVESFIAFGHETSLLHDVEPDDGDDFITYGEGGGI